MTGAGCDAPSDPARTRLVGVTPTGPGSAPVTPDSRPPPHCGLADASHISHIALTAVGLVWELCLGYVCSASVAYALGWVF